MKMKELAKEFFEETKKTCFALDLKVLKEENLLQSKIGGTPYLETLEDIPYARSNLRQMRLLAQINFSEVPENNKYPKEGILQFWLAQGHDLYGLNFKDQRYQEDWRVVFYPKIKGNLSLEEVQEALEVDKDDIFPLCDSYSIEYVFLEKGLYQEHEGFYRKVKEFLAKRNLGLTGQEFTDFMNAIIACNQFYESSLGGHPVFCQIDPRIEEKYADYTELLLQIDSEKDIMWGDSGIGNFFIKPHHLAQGKFEDILYNWDCL